MAELGDPWSLRPSPQQHLSPPYFSTCQPLTCYCALLIPNLYCSVAELYEHALKYEPSTHITSSGALATLSGAKTGRSPK